MQTLKPIPVVIFLFILICSGFAIAQTQIDHDSRNREQVFTGVVSGYLDETLTDYIPLEGAHVEVLVNGGDTFYADTWSDADGGFFFEANWPEDNWPFFHNAQARVSMEDYGQQEITVDFGSWPVVHDFYLEPLGNGILLFGFVTSINSSDVEVPVSGAQITLFHIVDGSPLDQIFTTEQGYYAFGASAYEAGSVMVTAVGFGTQTADLEGYPEEPVQMDFLLVAELDPDEYGRIHGVVTAQLSEGGDSFPMPNSLVTASSSSGPPLLFETVTDETGAYELNVPGTEIPWIITCMNVFGDQTEQVVLLPMDDIQLDFQFNGWQLPSLPGPRNLTAVLSEDETTVWLNWDVPEEWPSFCSPLYEVHANTMNDPDNDWRVVGETAENFYTDFPEPPEGLPQDVCYRVIGYCMELPSDWSNIACIQSFEEPFPPPPNGLTALYLPDEGLAGSVLLDWFYPVMPEPDMVPEFQVYANLGELSGDEFVFAGSTENHQFQYYFGDFVEPDPLNCFRIQALVGEDLSAFSNTECVNLDEEPTGDFNLWGHVYIPGEEPEMISGAGIQAYNIMTQEEFETASGEDGYYLLPVPPGEYDITARMGETILQQHHFILQNGWGMELDFWMGDFPDSHGLTGMVYGRLAEGTLIPLTDAELVAQQAGLYLYTSSFAGSYELDLPWSGDWNITVSADDFDTQTQAVYVNVNTEHDFTLNPLQDLYPAWLRLESLEAIPGDTIQVTVEIESLQPVSEIAFLLTESPEWLTLLAVEEGLGCFITSSYDMGDAVNFWIYSTEDCLLDPGVHTVASLQYIVDENAILGEDILLDFGSPYVFDEYGNEILLILESGLVSLQMLGDVTPDGTLNVLDIVLMINYIIGDGELSEYQEWAADVNEDGIIDVLDIVLLVSWILE